jgi:hypothetical protein
VSSATTLPSQDRLIGGQEDAMTTPSKRRERSKFSARGRPELAAEFLKRNTFYRTEHARMQRRIARGAVAREAAEAAFARRWGLSFRLSAG